MTKTLRRAVAALATVATASVAFASQVAAQSYYTTTSGDYVPLSNAAAGTAFAGFGLIWCCALCIPLIILIALAIFVYKDAEKNKVDNAAIWAILTFFTGIIGLLIYLLAIKPEAVKKNGGTPSTPTAM